MVDDLAEQTEAERASRNTQLQKKQLDDLINQRLETRRQSVDTAKNEIATFARWLAQNKCMESLLFWKEVEQFKLVFTSEERALVSAKIYDLYIKEGGLWQVSLKSEVLSGIEDAMKTDDVSEEVYDLAQSDVYEELRGLYANYSSEMGDVVEEDLSREEEAESLQHVLNATHPAQTRSFTRFTQEQLCEEALLFWIEANDYSLLFQDKDLMTKAEAIYDTYMSTKAKFKVCVSETMCASVKSAIDAKTATNALFAPSQKEVELFLRNDVFPRYQDWYKQLSTKPPPQNPEELHSTTSASDEFFSETLLGDRGAMHEALVKLLEIPEEEANLRIVARRMEAEENLDFYKDAREYKLLFSEQDRFEAATRIHHSYIDKSSDRLVTLPDYVVLKLTKSIVTDKSAPADLFDDAIRETVILISDNIYRPYIKERIRQQSSTATLAPSPAPANLPKTVGSSCCIIS